MFRTILGGMAALALGASATSAAAAELLADGGFGNQAAGVTSYCYGGFAAGGNAPCGPGAWTLANGGGLQNEMYGPWRGEPTPDGTHYAFIQNLGYIEQTFNVGAAGLVQFSWLEAGRPSGCCQGNQSYDVLLNNVVFASFSTTTNQPFILRNASATALAGANVLRFQGKNSIGDQTAFIDKVSAAVPEPGTWALMILGFGGAGAMLRRRQFAIAS